MQNQELANLIREERERRGLTMETLAQLAGVTKGTVYNIEKANAFARWDSLGPILETLELTVARAADLKGDSRQRRRQLKDQTAEKHSRTKVLLTSGKRRGK